MLAVGYLEWLFEHLPAQRTYLIVVESVQGRCLVG